MKKRKNNNYTGKLADYYNSNKNSEDRGYHTLLCVGITKRERGLPPLLLVQDSNPDRPFFQIGLDIVMDLGPKTLRPCTVPDDWTFNKNMEYMVSPETRALVAGSPMARDDNGVLRIIKSEEPVPRDIRYYIGRGGCQTRRALCLHHLHVGLLTLQHRCSTIPEI